MHGHNNKSGRDKAALFSSGDFSLVISSGGSRAILGGTGSAVAAHLAGITAWQSIGGVSGGSIPALLLASGKTPAQLIRMGMDCDFRSLVNLRTGLLSTLWKFLLKEYYETADPRPVDGVFSTEPLGDFIEKHVSTWPKNYWTMAACGDSQIVFTADGVHEYTNKGERIELSSQPAPLGLAIRATCTVPGIISAVHINGKYLYDGVHTRDGMCPVGVPIRYFGADATKTIACCFGEEFSKGWKGMVRGFWRWVWCVPPDPRWGPEAQGVISVKPELWHIHALKFNLTPDQKWLAILIGFQATVHRLERAGLLTGEPLKKAGSILTQLGDAQTLVNRCGKPGSCLALRAARAFEEHGLY